MKQRHVAAAAFLLILLSAAFGGLYIGQHFIGQPRNHHADSAGWHQALHEKLHITPEQVAKLSGMEKRYQQRRQYLEEQMRLANMELADAIKEDKAFSPRVQAATDKIHKVMGDLQKATLEHLFEIRPVLSEEQNRILEQMVTDALYEKQ